MADSGELRGIGGWLLVFIVALGVITPLTTLVMVFSALADPAMAEAYGADWSSIQAAEWTIALCAIAGAWFLVWRLIYVRTWKTVRYVIIGIWILNVASLALELALVSYFTGIPLTPLLLELGTEAVRPFVFCVVWTAYFLRSKRVANTYPRHGGQDQLAEVFG